MLQVVGVQKMPYANQLIYTPCIYANHKAVVAMPIFNEAFIQGPLS
jgi:uncharacterized protein (DUF1919 family)